MATPGRRAHPGFGPFRTPPEHLHETAGAGPVPVPPGGVSPTRIIAGQLGLADDPAGAPAPAGGDAAAIRALVEEIRGLRRDLKGGPNGRSAQGFPSYSAPQHATDDDINFFSYLPPVNVQMWYHYHTTQYVGAPLNTERTIGSETVPQGEIVILTNFTFLAARSGGGAANRVEMGRMELLRAVGFRLYVNNAPPGDVATISGANGAHGYGFDILQVDTSGFQPQFAFYVRPGNLIRSVYIVTAAPTVAPTEVSCILQGYKMPLADFQRALSRGSLF